MAVGDTAFYKTNTGAYRALTDTGNDVGLLQGGYQRFNDINAYQSAIQSDLAKYQDLTKQLVRVNTMNEVVPTGGKLRYADETGGTRWYAGDDPFQRMSEYQQELAKIQSGVGVYGQGYNTGDKIVNGNYTTAASLAQEQSYQDAVKAGTMKQTMVNGVPTYLPTQAPTMTSLNTPIPPATGNTASLPGYTTDASGYQSAYPTVNLQPGQSGENVKALQQYLISLGYDIPAGATGFYGPQTQAAVKALQEKLGVDYGANPGFFGPKTQAALSQMGLNLNPNAQTGGPKMTQGTSGYTGAVKATVDGMGTIPSTMLGANIDTSSVTAKRDTYQSLLEQYAQNQKNIADTKAKIAALNTQFAQGQTAIQGQTIPTGLEGAQAQALKEQIAFQQLPLTQQLDSYTEQTKVLESQKQTFTNIEKQAQDTFFNLSQQNPEINYNYNPALPAVDNLANLKALVAQKKTLASEDLSPRQATMFNSLVSQANRSPLIMAADRAVVLRDSISNARKEPSKGYTQQNLVYSYIQALDTYQSAVREGEMKAVSNLDSLVGRFSNVVQQINNGQYARPEVALQMADAAELLYNSISAAAKAKDSSFKAQADVLGLGEEWDVYRGKFQRSYETSPTSVGTGNITIGEDWSW